MPGMTMDMRGDLSTLALHSTIMMIAMMLPAVLPWIAAGGIPFTLGYSIVWSAFGMLAAAAQWQFGAVPQTMAYALIAAAIVYEFSAPKRRFLHACKAGIAEMGPRSAFRIGLRQGIWCVGCCWLVMIAAFALGPMNIGIMIAATMFITFQRLAS